MPGSNLDLSKLFDEKTELEKLLRDYYGRGGDPRVDRVNDAIRRLDRLRRNERNPMMRLMLRISVYHLLVVIYKGALEARLDFESNLDVDDGRPESPRIAAAVAASAATVAASLRPESPAADDATEAEAARPSGQRLRRRPT